MSMHNNRKSNRRLGFENLEAREYLTADGWSAPIAQIEIGPIPQITSHSVSKEIELDADLIFLPPTVSQLQALEADELLRDLSHDIFSANGFVRPDIRTNMGDAGLREPPQEQPDDLIITVSLTAGPAINPKPGAPFGSSISIGGIYISREFESKPDYRPPLLPPRFTQEIIASYGASFISNNNSSPKAEVTNVSLSSSSFKLSANTQPQSTSDTDIDVAVNRQSEATSKTPGLNSLKDAESRVLGLSEFDQFWDELHDENIRVSDSQAPQPQFKSQSPSSLQRDSTRSSNSDLKNDDGLIALSNHYDLLPTVPIGGEISPQSSSIVWTQRVAIGQTMQALRPSPKSQAQLTMNAQAKDEATEEPQQSSQYWAIVPLAASMLAIDWFRRHLHLRKQKPEDETFVSKVQLR